jgi:ribosome-associated protein
LGAKKKLKELDSKEKAVLIAGAVLEKKATDLLVLDVREISTIADYFVICSGNTSRQVKAIAEEVDYRLSLEREYYLRIEGFPECRWVLMDYGDIIVHIFEPETREFYDLDGLWGDAPRLQVGS